MIWHNIDMRDSHVQQLPKILRKYPLHYTPLERKLFDYYCRYLRLPAKLKRMFGKKNVLQNQKDNEGENSFPSFR